MDLSNGENFRCSRCSRDKKVNIGTFYLTYGTDIWWNTIKNRLLRSDFTLSIFMEELNTLLRIAKWELTNTRGAVAQSTLLLPVPED